MNVGRLVIALVVVVVVYGIVTQPLSMAGMTRDGVGQLGVAGDRAAQFMMALVSGGGSAEVVPTGGAATGDGSSVAPAGPPAVAPAPG